MHFSGGSIPSPPRRVLEIERSKMFGNNLENAYTYEIERRKDEMREAAHSQLVRQVVHTKVIGWRQVLDHSTQACVGNYSTCKFLKIMEKK
jgi:hypothetical protein